jgi:hypothetical protein
MPSNSTGSSRWKWKAPSVSRRALFRRVAFVIGVGVILGVAISGTIMQRRSLADYSSARSGVRSDIRRFEAVLVKGESRARAVATLRAAGAHVDSPHGDIVITVLRELASSAQCRSLVGQLHVGIDRHDRVDGWEAPPLDAECD